MLLKPKLIFVSVINQNILLLGEGVGTLNKKYS